MPSATLPRNGNGATILYIEDNLENRMLVRAVLEAAGYRLIDTEDGLSGIEVAIREQPALILLDINLPGVQGYEVATILKSFPELAVTPVIALTAYAMEGDRERTLVAGCDGYIRKPIDIEAFPSQVAEFLKGKRERVEEHDGCIYLRDLYQQLVHQLVDRLAELKELNQQIARRATQLEDLHRAVQGTTSDLGVVPMLERLLPALVQALGLRSLAVELNDPAGVRVAATGEAAQPSAGVLAPTEGKLDDDWGEVVCTCPLTIGEQCLGAMVARDALPMGAKANDESLLKMVANHVAMAVANCRLYGDLKAQMAQLKQTQSQLIQAEKLSATGHLAAGVAHEINNPLSVILGLAMLTLEKKPPAEVAEKLEGIRGEALRAARIVRDLLAFARPRSSEWLPLDLNEVLRQTVALQAYHLRADQIEVVWNLTEPLPQTLGDVGQIQQVILNLTLNAHQAMKSANGRGTLTIETGRGDGRIWAKIRDDGPGIEPELLPRVLDPFVSTKPVGQGTGLGLSISHGIIQAHGGQLRVESEVGHGATFTILLPVVEVGTAPSEPVEPVPPPTRPLSVLVVDDEPRVAGVLSAMLERLGHRADVAHSGRAALEMLERGAYDLVTLDLKMPDMSGREVWEALQEFPPPRRPKVLFVTGDIATAEATAFLTLSGQPYLEKPFQPAEIARKISELGF